MTRVRTRAGRRPTPGVAAGMSEQARAMVKAAWENVEHCDNKSFGEMYATALERRVYDNDLSLTNFMKRLTHAPVDIEEFLDSPEFLGATDITLWPEVRKAIIEANRYWWKGVGKGAYGELLLMGSTGSGKSEIAKITTLYHLYLVHCLDNPQAYYGLPKATSIVFAIMAAKPHVTKKVLYDPMRHMVENMPYFQKHIRPSKLVESEMIFEDKNIRVTPGGVDADTLLGEAVIGGIIDEINFMNIVLKSKRADVTSGRAGIYDQAQTIYTTMTRRVKGRFSKPGPRIGIVCPSSSTRYTGDFTDKRKAHVLEHREKGVYIYDRPQYEVRPAENYCGETFRLLVGNDMQSDVRILGENDTPPEGSRILDIPIEYESDFKKDPYSALRDICGISTSSVSPFLRRRFKIYEAIEAAEEAELESFLVKDNVILGIDGMPTVKFGEYCKDPSNARYVHIDLSVSGDRCGVAMVKFAGTKDIPRSNGVVERLPLGYVELACSIEPDANAQIDFSEVRTWVKQLRDVYGFPIKAVTYDGIFSIESIQQWRKMGMKTGNLSVDRTSVPYKTLRDALDDNRIIMYEQPVLVGELFDLEHDVGKDKIDHPPNGCFVGSTLVATEYGPLPISEVKAGMRVWSFGGAADLSYVTGSAMTKETSELVDVYMENGSVFRCTPEHRFLLKSGEYRQAQHLTCDDELQD